MRGREPQLASEDVARHGQGRRAEIAFNCEGTTASRTSLRSRNMRRSILAIVMVTAFGWPWPAHANVAWQEIEQAVGRKATVVPGEVHRFGFPRSDLKVTLDGVQIKPALALGSWLAFKQVGDGAMVMGDLVLTSEEIGPVMKRLAEGGIDITAVHNPLLRSSPVTMYMHVEGHGDAVKLAQTLHAALSLSKMPLGAPTAAASSEVTGLDTATLE